MTDHLDPAVYERAADVLDADGWIQDEASNEHGRCAIGAIVRALDDVQPLDERIKAATEYRLRLWSHLGGSLLDWNDAPGRTKDEVIDLFRTAAEKLRADRGELA